MVEWKKLGEIARRNKGIPITARQMSELASSDGNVRVFAAGSTIADIDETKLPKNCAHKLPSIIVKSRGYIDFEFYEKPFTHKNEMWSYSFVNKQEGKFIYYFLTTKTELFRTKAKANSVKLPQLCVADTDNYLIPIPSLEEQNRIVGILDTFTASIDNLKGQIAQRRKQYEYYRDQLLDLEGKEGVEMKTLGEIFDTRNGYTPSTSNSAFWDGGVIPWFKMEDIRDNGRILSDSNLHITPFAVKGKGLFKANSIILATSATIGEHALITVEHLCNQRFTNFYPNKDYADKVNMKYFYYYMFVIDEWCKQHLKQGSFASVDMTGLFNLLIPVPSLSEQQRIVDILDKFEASIQNLEAQLSQREKQYEYYRNKLLTFE